jgi:hypothetical protein
MLDARNSMLHFGMSDIERRGSFHDRTTVALISPYVKSLSTNLANPWLMAFSP